MLLQYNNHHHSHNYQSKQADDPNLSSERTSTGQEEGSIGFVRLMAAMNVKVIAGQYGILMERKLGKGRYGEVYLTSRVT
jgi:hypothetical protein